MFTLPSLSLFHCSYTGSLDTSTNNSTYSGHATCTLIEFHTSKNVIENQDMKSLLEKKLPLVKAFIHLYTHT